MTALRARRLQLTAALDTARATAAKAATECTLAEERGRTSQAALETATVARDAELARFPESLTIELSAAQAAAAVASEEQKTIATEVASLESTIAEQTARIEAAVSGARAAVERAYAELELAEEARTTVLKEHAAEGGRLEALRSVSRQADDEDQAAEAARASTAALTAQVDATSAELENWQQQRPGLSRERDQAAEAGQRLPAVQAEADRYGRAADDASALAVARVDKSRQEEAWFAAKMEYLELFEDASRLRRGRIE